ncbi:hypothetical protein [Pedobacter sp. ASV28]|uniref:hypothetical protein n=1 Tax=Pedobacter sp. ASV28 TaxID=2795123 RepID=UPI0018EB2CFE|nr:hypothetical protein [Pedobacter sp. ASV28]
MKKIIIISGLLLLAVQVNSQGLGGLSPTAPAPPPTPKSTYDTGETINITRSYSSTTNKGRTVVTNIESQAVYNNIQDPSDEPQRSKTFSRSFNIGRDDKINISNIYGSIIFKTWDKNEVKVDADIKAYASTDEEAQKLIDNVSISSSKNADEAIFKTSMQEPQGNWGSGSRNGKRWRREVKVYMTVYLPSNVALTASQQYGNIEMGDFSGPTALKVQYGKLTTGNLNNVNNFISAQYASVDMKDINKATIKQQYGSGLSISSIGDLSLNAQYAVVRIGTIKRSANIKQQYGSGLSIESVDNLELNAQYASVKLGTVKGDANIKIQYGSGLSIEQVGNLSLTSQYTGVRIGRITGILTANAQYGSRLSLEKIEASSKMININAEYITVMLDFAPNYGGSLNVDTHYSGFKYGENINAKKMGDDDRGSSSSKEYSGTIGRGGPSNVKISAKYGSVTFK